MRELTKSALSLSWALSLLGIDQTVNLVRPGNERKSDVFAPITQVAADQLGDSLKPLFRFGDNVQSSMIDMAFSMMNPSYLADINNWNPMNLMKGCGSCSDKKADPAAGERGQQPNAG